MQKGIARYRYAAHLREVLKSYGQMCQPLVHYDGFGVFANGCEVTCL